MKRNPQIEKKINEYYTISNNLQNSDFLSRKKINPTKNSNLFKFLPNKLNDKNFKLMSRQENETINLYELFIDRNVNSIEDLNFLYEGLKSFVQEYLTIEELKKNFDVLYLNYRRQFRLDIKKKYGILREDKLLQCFLDQVVFFTRDYSQLEEIVKGFIAHIEKFYL